MLIAETRPTILNLKTVVVTIAAILAQFNRQNIQLPMQRALKYQVPEKSSKEFKANSR